MQKTFLLETFLDDLYKALSGAVVFKILLSLMTNSIFYQINLNCICAIFYVYLLILEKIQTQRDGLQE